MAEPIVEHKPIEIETKKEETPKKIGTPHEEVTKEEEKSKAEDIVPPINTDELKLAEGKASISPSPHKVEPTAEAIEQSEREEKILAEGQSEKKVEIKEEDIPQHISPKKEEETKKEQTPVKESEAHPKEMHDSEKKQTPKAETHEASPVEHTKEKTPDKPKEASAEHAHEEIKDTHPKAEPHEHIEEHHKEMVKATADDASPNSIAPTNQENADNKQPTPVKDGESAASNSPQVDQVKKAEENAAGKEEQVAEDAYLNEAMEMKENEDEEVKEETKD